MNSLQHMDEFKQVLANYQLSQESRTILTQTKLVLLLGPTSSGRNTIINELLKSGDYHFIVSDTTRAPRTNQGVIEQDGIDYWFRQEEDVLADLKDGKFLEAEVIHAQQVSGISMRELQKAVEAGKIAINDVDVSGVRNVIDLKPDTVAIMVLPPSFKEWQRRLTGRGEMSPADLRHRMDTAVRVFTESSQSYYKFVINDTVDHAAQQIRQIVESQKVDEALQNVCKALAEQLLTDTKKYISTLD
jgi:guanylate kinase